MICYIKHGEIEHTMHSAQGNSGSEDEIGEDNEGEDDLDIEYVTVPKIWDIYHCPFHAQWEGKLIGVILACQCLIWQLIIHENNIKIWFLVMQILSHWY